METNRPLELRARNPSAHDIIDPIVNIYYPALLDSVHACLAVVGSMALAGRTKPLSLILETPSGYGKSAVLQMFFPPPESKLSDYIYRSDKFTPKSFVTHAANVKKAQLRDLDLLPKLAGKTLVTKELAPLFRGREEEMQENFSVLISVLDGKGFTSDTGMHGQRGYQGDLVFNWIGATTPFPPSVHSMMSQLGTRFLFYEVPAIPPTEDELVAYAQANQASSAEKDCQRAVRTFLIDFFESTSVDSVPRESIEMTDDQCRDIVRWAQFLVAARAEVRCEKQNSNWTPVAAMRPEGPWKVVEYFKDIALGHALVCGRMYMDPSDIELVAHVALSSIPAHLRPIVRELRRSAVDTKMVERLCSVTAPTARNYLKQLELLRIGDLKPGSPVENRSDRMSLTETFEWMRINLEIQV